LIVTRPRGDLRSNRGLHPSRWLPELLGGTDAPERRHIGSFRHGIRSSPVLATDQEALLAVLDRGGAPVRADEPVVVQDLALTRAVRLRQARASDELTPFDGNLTSVAPLPPLGGERPVSPSRLEQWMRCPYAYFARYLLRVDAVESPEDLLELSPVERGNLVHSALEELVRSALADGQAPAPGEAWADERVAALHASLAQLAAQAEERGLTGLPLFWRRQQRKLARWMRTFLGHEATLRRDHGAGPVAVEVVFGADGAAPVEIDLPGGATLRLAGRIDRIDRGAGRIVVTDYKTSRRRSLMLGKDHPLGRASDRLQLPIYGLAARQLLERPDDAVHACYLCISDDPGVVVLALDDAIFDRLRGVIAVAAAGIEGGLFPAHPEGGTGWLRFVSCWYCDPDGLGTSSARARWERKRADPALAGYVALAEPGAA
jgi:RecB family exonuclease